MTRVNIVGINLTVFIFKINELLAQFFYNPHEILGLCQIGAGCASTILEILYLVYVLLDAPIFGLGFDYGGLSRTMTLNGITELTLKFGLVGLFTFFYCLIGDFTSRRKAYFFCCTVLFLLTNGSIAQPYFWVWFFPIFYTFTNDKERN